MSIWIASQKVKLDPEESKQLSRTLRIGDTRYFLKLVIAAGFIPSVWGKIVTAVLSISSDTT